MAVTMPLFWMKSIWRWKVEGAPLSQPMKTPPWPGMPPRWMRLMSPIRSRCGFWVWLH